MAERPELGFSSTNLLNPWELRHAACESFLKLIENDGSDLVKNSLGAVLHEQPQYDKDPDQYYK